MKTLELNQMENVDGGNFMDGACAVFDLTGLGVGVAAYYGGIALTGWGAALLLGGAAACLIYAYS